MQPDRAIAARYWFIEAPKGYGATARTARACSCSHSHVRRVLRRYVERPQLIPREFVAPREIPCELVAVQQPREQPAAYDITLPAPARFSADDAFLCLARAATLLLAACAVVAARRDLGAGLGLSVVSCGVFWISMRMEIVS